MKFIPQVITQKVGRELLTIRKGSPGILFGLGIAGSIASTVLACRATLKLSDVLDEMQSDVDATKELKHSSTGLYPEKTENKDLAYAYAFNAYRVVKLYAPAALVGVAAIGCLTGSHVTLTRRNAGLTAAYSALQMSFDSYRERVREELGKERELEIHHAAHKETIEVDGKIKQLMLADPNKWSPYAKMFDEFNPNWVKNAEQNRLFVQCQQNYFNHLLHSRGHVFLNEVYDALGFEHTEAGAVVGWVLGHSGDNYIDFGLFEAASTEFINGYERSIILDFNVDGVIYKLL